MTKQEKIIAKQNELIERYKFLFDIDLGNEPDQPLITLESELKALQEEPEEEKFIITVSQRVKDILNLGDNENSVHDANIMDMYQNEAIRFLAKQIDILHNVRIKSNKPK
jgi:hypothetical protein